MDTALDLAERITVLHYGSVIVEGTRAEVVAIPKRVRSILATEALALNNINAAHGDSHVLHDVSFALEAGRVLALLGRNGAGKTTCMSAIIGLLPPRDGEIRLFGDVRDASRAGGHCAQRRRLRAAGPADFPDAQRVRKPHRRPSVAGGGTWTLERVLELLSRLRAAAAGSGLAFRRRTADARDRPRADGQTRACF